MTTMMTTATTYGETGDPWRIRERRCAREEPFSRILKAESPRVWDVICSTLVLYRSTAGLDRGVGVFKGDYTQRQGWLYWRTSPAVLTCDASRNSPGFERARRSSVRGDDEVISRFF